MSNISLFFAILRRQKGLCCDNAKSYLDIRSNVVRYGNVTFGQIAAFLLVLSLGLPIPSKAEVYWDENFESQLNAGGKAPWNTDSCEYMDPTRARSPWPDGCNPRRATTVAHSGSNSLDADYTANNGLDVGVWITRPFPDSSDVWIRYYFYLDSNYSCCTDVAPKNGLSKQFFVRNTNYTSGLDFDWIVSMYYGRNISLELEGPTGKVFGDGYSLNRNQWYCVEVHLNSGTAGNSDGTVQTWIDGTQRMNSRNVATTPAGRTNIVNEIRIFAQSADGGHRYIDDFAVGNTRIGCGDPLPSLPPPPNVRVQ